MALMGKFSESRSSFFAAIGAVALLLGITSYTAIEESDRARYLSMWLTALGFVGLSTAALQAFKGLQRRRDCSFARLWIKFGEKMAMTAGLGLFFLLLYLIIALYVMPLVNKQLFLSGFFYGLDHPALYFYLGGALFIGNALLICLIRAIIKAVCRAIR